MKKLGLCVCYDTQNYGSQLQVLATQEALRAMQCDYEIIRYQKRLTPLFLIRSLPRLLEPTFVGGKRRKLCRAIGLRKHPELARKAAQRTRRFQRFVAEYFTKLSPIYCGYDQLKQCVTRYDGILVGSDQLWLPAGLASGFYTLMFVPEDKIKIAYATSFGVSRIPRSQRTRTAWYLNRIQWLSTREWQGAKIIKQLTTRDAAVNVDPTLLLTAQEWEQRIPRRRVVQPPYIFCYFLGSVPAHRMAVRQLREQTGLPVVCLPHLDEFVAEDLDFGDHQLFDIGADDFVNLIRSAEYVCTDSFHGTVFSILYHKKFLTFDRFAAHSRESRNSRIDSLLYSLGLEQRRYRGGIEAIYDAWNEAETACRLQHLREQSRSWLKQAVQDVPESNELSGGIS